MAQQFAPASKHEVLEYEQPCVKRMDDVQCIATTLKGVGYPASADLQSGVLSMARIANPRQQEQQSAPATKHEVLEYEQPCVKRMDDVQCIVTTLKGVEYHASNAQR